MSIITMFPSDDHELRMMLHEANELRRARGLRLLEPRWRVQRNDLLPPRLFVDRVRRLLRPAGGTDIGDRPRH